MGQGLLSWGEVGACKQVNPLSAKNVSEALCLDARTLFS